MSQIQRIWNLSSDNIHSLIYIALYKNKTDFFFFVFSLDSQPKYSIKASCDRSPFKHTLHITVMVLPFPFTAHTHTHAHTVNHRVFWDGREDFSQNVSKCHLKKKTYISKLWKTRRPQSAFVLKHNVSLKPEGENCKTSKDLFAIHFPPRWLAIHHLYWCNIKFQYRMSKGTKW